MRTNTPLHALTLLNDVGMLEAASTIAAAAIDAYPRPDDDSRDPDSLDDVDARLTNIFNRILTRTPLPIELDAMRETYRQSIQYYVTSPADAKTLIMIGQSKPGSEASIGDQIAAERAAMMIVASMVMNLDEAITHE
jgi:hypothetical protein